MEMLKIASFGILATLMILIVGKHKSRDSEYAMFIRLAAVIILMIFIIGQLGNVFTVVRDLANKIHMDSTYLNIVLKVVGIAYIAEFGYQLCKDAGEEAIGTKIQFAGKVMIFVIAAPVILALVELISDLL